MITLITLKNPTSALIREIRAKGVRVTEKFVRTCHSDTCACASHDSGYEEAQVELPPGTTMPPHGYVGGDVHGHGYTMLLETVLQRAEWYLARVCRRVDDNEVIHYARLAVELAQDREFASDEALDAEVRRVITERARAKRRENRAAWVREAQAAGLTAEEAHALYGAGVWAKELSCAQWSTLKQVDHVQLSLWAQARSGRELEGFPFTGSTPRRNAWARYACEAFYGAVLPVKAETVWKYYAEKAGVTVH